MWKNAFIWTEVATLWNPDCPVSHTGGGGCEVGRVTWQSPLGRGSKCWVQKPRAVRGYRAGDWAAPKEEPEEVDQLKAMRGLWPHPEGVQDTLELLEADGCGPVFHLLAGLSCLADWINPVGWVESTLLPRCSNIFTWVEFGSSEQLESLTCLKKTQQWVVSQGIGRPRPIHGFGLWIK